MYFFLGSSLDAKKPLQDFNRDPMMPSAPMTKSTSFPRAEWGSSSSSSSSSAGGTQTNSNSNSKPPLTRPTTAHPRSRVEMQPSHHQNAADQFLEPPAGGRQLAVRPTTAHPRSNTEDQNLQSGESPRIVGGAAAPAKASAKCRPLSAMANMSRGQASTSEKVSDFARHKSWNIVRDGQHVEGSGAYS